MTAKERAENYLYELYNVAEHVTRCTEDARRAVATGDADYAREALGNCKRSAELFEMRWMDALKAVAEFQP